MKKILIVVDMQNDFIDGALGTKEAESIVDYVAFKIKNFDGPIFVTLDTHGGDYLETEEGKKLPVPHCIKMTHGWLLHEKVYRALAGKSYKLLEKKTFGAKKLVKQLRELGNGADTEMELVGLCTDICVVSNALLLKAFFPNAVIRVDAAGCAGVTPQSHKAALETMKMCQIDVSEDLTL